MTFRIVRTNRGEKGIECLDCGFTSWNRNDVKHKYCGNCHEFHDTKEWKKRWK